MSKRIKNEIREALPSANPLGRLAALEYKYRIDRKPLEDRLRAAIEEQRQLDDFIREHAQQTQNWERFARQRKHAAGKVAAAVDLLRDELRLSRFSDPARAHLSARLFMLRKELGVTIPIQEKAGLFLSSVAGGSLLRAEGRPAASVVNVNACLAELVAHLQHRNGKPKLPGEVCRLYVASLAQFCGFLDADLKNPAEALRKRLGRRHSFMTYEQAEGWAKLMRVDLRGRRSDGRRSRPELAAEAFEVVHGRWPPPWRDLPSPKLWKSLERTARLGLEGRKPFRSKQSGRRGRNKNPPV